MNEQGALSGRANNFDALRLLAAAAVIVTHCYPLTGRAEGLDPLSQKFYAYSFSFIGLRLFFFVSGFLIAQSLIRSNGIADYAWKRFLRLIPGLVVALTVCIVVLGLGFGSMPFKEYLSNAETWSYYKNATLFLLQWSLPGVFATNVYGTVVNGSLWTLMYEVTCYIGLLGFSLGGGFKKRWFIALVFAAAITLRFYFYFYPKYYGAWYSVGITNLNVKFTLDFGLYFLAGTLIYVYRELIVLRWWLAALSLGLFLGLGNSSWGDFGAYLGLPYLIIYLAYSSSLSIANRAGRFGDFSYGLYIYAFPVQQAIISLWPSVDVLSLFCTTITVTLSLAYLSWHLVEKPMLGFKNYFAK